MYRVVGINGAGKVTHNMICVEKADNLAYALVNNNGPSGRPSFPVSLVEKNVGPVDFPLWRVLTQYP